MAVTISRAVIASAAAHNARMPDEERWSRLVKASGRLARRVTRKGITASELRDEQRQRAQDFGSELPRCRRHGAKGSTKTLPGRGKGYGIGVINTNIRWRNSMIAAGLIKPIVVRNGVQLRTAVVDLVMAPTDRQPAQTEAFNMLKRMLNGAQPK